MFFFIIILAIAAASAEMIDSSNTLNNNNIVINHNRTVVGSNSPETNLQYSSVDIASSSEMMNESEGEGENTPLNGQIYPPFKSMSTLIEEVNYVNESLKQQESNVQIHNQNPTIKSIKSSESIKYYLDGSKRPKDEPVLSPEENAMLTKNILTSDTNIGTDDLTKTMNYFCEIGSSDMTLNQKID